MKNIVRALLGGLGLALCIATTARAEPEKLYFFSNSLMHHLTNSTTTTVPHWLGHFADNAGRSIRLDGQWGFEREFKDKLPPEPEWKFKTVKSAWGNARNFKSVGYDSIVFNLTNFIQYRGPSKVYEWDNPKRETPVSVSLNLLDKTANGKRSLSTVVGATWSLMAIRPQNANCASFTSITPVNFTTGIWSLCST